MLIKDTAYRSVPSDQELIAQYKQRILSGASPLPVQNRLNAVVLNTSGGPEEPLSDYKDEVQSRIDQRIAEKSREVRPGRLVVPSIEELEARENRHAISVSEQPQRQLRARVDSERPVEGDKNADLGEERHADSVTQKSCESGLGADKPDYSGFSGDFRRLLENKYSAYLQRTQKEASPHKAETEIGKVEPVPNVVSQGKKEKVQKKKRKMPTKTATKLYHSSVRSPPPAQKRHAETNSKKLPPPRPHSQADIRRPRTAATSKPATAVKPGAKAKISTGGKAKKKYDVTKVLQIARRHMKECPKFAAELRSVGFS